MGLNEYHRKRQFKETPEPKGTVSSHQKKSALRFVVQRHQASHLHYDFRLEADGVLKSWAIPKGPSMNPADRRLAIMVEDHPFDYRTFEGTIPEGHYGAGTVEIWDEGTYTASEASNTSESEKLIKEGLKQGRLNFIMNGKKLKGEFSLIRLQRDQDNQWLLIKKKDAFASSVPLTKDEKPKSASRSKKTNRTSKPDQDKPSSTPSTEMAKTSMPHSVKPMLATLVDAPFDHKDWVFEMKWDGYRALAEIQNGSVQLYSRTAQSFNKRFFPLIEELKKIPLNALLDGEIVILDEEGKASFQLVQNYHRWKKGRLVYFVFDLLYLEGYDVRTLPLIQRKKLLKKLLPPNSEMIQYCSHIVEKGTAFFNQAVKKGLEGIIAKHAQSAYKQGRSKEWLKIKTHRHQEAIICGYTEPKGSREHFGSLVLGAYTSSHELVYIGHTGSGFDRQQLAEIYTKLNPLIQSRSTFKNPPKTRFPVTWIKPELVCEVAFAEWTRDQQMRQAIFIDFREDKKPEDVVIEHSLPTNRALQEAKEEEIEEDSDESKNQSAATWPIKVSHPEKIYWPEEGYTKGDLIEYYEQIAPYIMPYLKDRPETLNRYPNGIDEESFYQKNVTNPPDWIRTEKVKHENRTVSYILVDNEKSLLYLVNLGCIGMHPFHSRIETLHYPDYLILDLDPENIDFEYVIEVAQTIHQLLEKLSIPNVCKTSGSRGLHIYVPMGAQYDYVQVGQFSKLLATLIHQSLPDITSLDRDPEKRQKKVYIDYLRNSFGQTTAAPYSVRPKPGATVSTPLKWSEVKKGLDPHQFTIETVSKRLQKVGDLFQPILGPGIDLAACLKKLDRLL